MATAWTSDNGYIRVTIGGHDFYLHRLIMEEHLDRALGDAETVDHVCHNVSTCNLGVDCPHRRCIEITHLEVVDQPTNWRRGRLGAVAKRRALTHCPANHPYSGDNLYVIPSTGARSCRACHRDRERVRRAER